VVVAVGVGVAVVVTVGVTVAVTVAVAVAVGVAVGVGVTVAVRVGVCGETIWITGEVAVAKLLLRSGSIVGCDGSRAADASIVNVWGPGALQTTSQKRLTETRESIGNGVS